MYRVEFWPAWYLQMNVCARLEGDTCSPYRSRSGAVLTTRASLMWCPGGVHPHRRQIVTIWCLFIAVPDTDVADKSLTKGSLVLRGRKYAGAGAAEMKNASLSLLSSTCNSSREKDAYWRVIYSASDPSASASSGGVDYAERAFPQVSLQTSSMCGLTALNQNRYKSRMRTCRRCPIDRLRLSVSLLA